jgi:hypothetical protein
MAGFALVAQASGLSTWREFLARLRRSRPPQDDATGGRP